MLVSDRYCLRYYKDTNKIVIALPPTWKTLQGTTDTVVNRRTDIDETELAPVLAMVKKVMQEVRE